MFKFQNILTSFQNFLLMSPFVYNFIPLTAELLKLKSNIFAVNTKSFKLTYSCENNSPNESNALGIIFFLVSTSVVSTTKSGYFKTRSTKTREWRLKMYFENKKIERETCIRSDHQIVKLQLLGAWPTNGRSCMVGGLRKQDTSLFWKKKKLDDELY